MSDCISIWYGATIVVVQQANRTKLGDQDTPIANHDTAVTMFWRQGLFYICLVPGACFGLFGALQVQVPCCQRIHDRRAHVHRRETLRHVAFSRHLEPSEKLTTVEETAVASILASIKASIEIHSLGQSKNNDGAARNADGTMKLSSSRLPFVTLTYAQALDGSIAGPRGAEGARLILSGPKSMALTHGLRAIHDAILVGANTVLVNPALFFSSIGSSF